MVCCALTYNAQHGEKPFTAYEDKEGREQSAHSSGLIRSPIVHAQTNSILFNILTEKVLIRLYRCADLPGFSPFADAIRDIL